MKHLLGDALRLGLLRLLDRFRDGDVEMWRGETGHTNGWKELYERAAVHPAHLFVTI
jgi:hypothetical protein